MSSWLQGGLAWSVGSMPCSRWRNVGDVDQGLFLELDGERFLGGEVGGAHEDGQFPQPAKGGLLRG